jgi:desulfoferrodoxin (superoxide reductase-like protein)
MKKIAIFVLAVLAFSVVPLSAGVPIVQVQVPRKVTAGDEVTLEITITHRDNTADHHINYVYLYQDNALVKEWVWTVNDFIAEDQFMLTYTTVLEKDTVFLIKAHCTLHGDKKITASIEVMPYVQKPRAIILANAIDANRSESLVDFLEDNGFEVEQIGPNQLEEYKTEELIIILGGADALDGVGPIVRTVLDEREQELTRLGIRYFKKTDVWAPNQRVFIFAGPDRDQTKEAHTTYRDKIL